MMKVDILTLFPEMFAGPFAASILKRAQEHNLIEINLVNIRDFSTNKHHTVDDTPYGGGAGMVMGPEALFHAVEHVYRGLEATACRVVLMCPQGRPFSQALAGDLARGKNLILVCGHYEGIDERVRETLVTDEVSIGDYVLTGGELPALVVIDAVARHIPGVIGAPEGPETDSFADGLLEYPQYTRPADFEGRPVPEVLLSGNHEAIRRWRRRQALLRTLQRRPDLLNKIQLSPEDRTLLDDLKRPETEG